MKLKFIIGVVGILSACGFTNAPSLDTTQEEQDNNWAVSYTHLDVYKRQVLKDM